SNVIKISSLFGDRVKSRTEKACIFFGSFSNEMVSLALDFGKLNIFSSFASTLEMEKNKSKR
ncbi:MAG TPA: hypothetical protein PKZ14_04745, partial [Chitinophagales bacterium]|nr:hypothetical protein [Chitinophagales bacterium]